jgi:DNA-binding NarL/FixJ family response regulator
MSVGGCSNKEIAAPLGIEERTVKGHVSKLFRKVGASSRVMLSVYAITHSLGTSINKSAPFDRKITEIGVRGIPV